VLARQELHELLKLFPVLAPAFDNHELVSISIRRETCLTRPLLSPKMKEPDHGNLRRNINPWKTCLALQQHGPCVRGGRSSCMSLADEDITVGDGARLPDGPHTPLFRNGARNHAAAARWQSPRLISFLSEFRRMNDGGSAFSRLVMASSEGIGAKTRHVRC
jgi:hypothetical protein